MSDPTRGTDRDGRRAKRFLTPSQKYEIFLQLVRQEVTMAEAAGWTMGVLLGGVRGQRRGFGCVGRRFRRGDWFDAL